MFKDILELTKAKLASFVILTAAVGYVVAARDQFDWLQFAITVLGTAGAAFCANAFNQVIEVERDAKMARTVNRPIPAGRMTRVTASLIAASLGVAGVASLAMWINLLTAALGLLTIFLYLAVYTPLKPRSHINTLVGSVVGAIPPMMGWTAVTNSIDSGAWALGSILFVWQIPHFLALAWMYRRDYAAGGYKMLPIADESGQQTARITVVWAFLMLPASLSIVWLRLAGFAYGAVSVVAGLWLIWLAFKFLNDKKDQSSRKLFFASITYLPIVLLVMVIDKPSYWF
jgi:protoheme IX farnesyltransferase